MVTQVTFVKTRAARARQAGRNELPAPAFL
jgi:hypothetical protein